MSKLLHRPSAKYPWKIFGKGKESARLTDDQMQKVVREYYSAIGYAPVMVLPLAKVVTDPRFGAEDD